MNKRTFFLLLCVFGAVMAFSSCKNNPGECESSAFDIEECQGQGKTWDYELCECR